VAADRLLAAAEDWWRKADSPDPVGLVRAEVKFNDENQPQRSIDESRDAA
jgi:hypothetical protein